MKPFGLFLLWVTLGLAPLFAGIPEWPQWRGPRSDGFAPGAHPPVEWGVNRHVKWTFELPGEGHSTPVIAGNILFLTLAVPVGPEREPIPETAEGAHDFRLVTREHEFRVVALDRTNGSMLWSTTVKRALPHEGGYLTGSYASSSPVTDGERVYASFGSHGVYALSLTGEVLWTRDLGVLRTHHGHGEGSSPALANGRLVVVGDQETGSFMAALDTQSGDLVWKTPRDEVTSWATPLIVEVDGRAQVITAATRRIRANDLETGRELWFCTGLSRNVVASPVHDRGVVMVSNSYEWQVLLGLRPQGATGDITNTEHVAWNIRRQTSYVASPVLLDGRLFYLGHLAGMMTGVDTQTGQVTHPVFRVRGINRVFSSPLAADGKIYVCDQEGTTCVIRPNPDGTVETLAVNRLPDRFAASPVAVGRTLYLRGARALYAVEEPNPAP